MSAETPMGRVLAVTQVVTPSTGHEDVPYWCSLVRDADGEQSIVKSDVKVMVGDEIAMSGATSQDVRTVGVLGSGVMGRGLTELLLGRGHRVVWVGRSAERLEGASTKVFERLERVMDESDLDEARARLTLTQDVGPLSECSLVIEAVIEELEPKAATLADVEKAMREDAVLASNTSGLPLDELAAVLEHPGRFGGLHFFNPPTRMRLVETAIAQTTDEDTSAFLDDFARELGKVPVRVAASPAFVVNRVLMPLLNEAVRVLEERVAEPEQIDEAVRLGLNHPMGPLALADLIGLDVVVRIMDDLRDRTGDEAYEARPMLRRMVEEGRLGRKAGRGFYDYSR